MSPLDRLEWLRRVMSAPLTLAQVKLAIALAVRTNSKTGDCFPSKACLIADTGLSEATVRRAVPALVEAGLLRVEFSNGRRANRYRLVTVNDEPNPVTADGVAPLNPVAEDPVAGNGSPINPVTGDGVRHCNPVTADGVKPVTGASTPSPVTANPVTGAYRNKGMEQEENTLSGSRPTARELVPISEAEKLVAFLNEKAGTAFKVRTNDGNLSRAVEAARQRIAEHGLETMRRVVAKQAVEWLGSDMAKYLRPETLFSKGKAESYVGLLETPSPKRDPEPTSAAHKPHPWLARGGR